MMNDLVKHIEKLNAEAAAWMAAGPDRWAGMLTTDLAHWEAYGITTPEQLDKYLVVCDVFEATRSAWDYKPSWSGLMATPIEELRKERDMLNAEIERQIALKNSEEQAHANAVRDAFTPKPFTIGLILA